MDLKGEYYFIVFYTRFLSLIVLLKDIFYCYSDNYYEKNQITHQRTRATT